MPDSVQRLDISHEALFSQPAFGLMREFPPVLKKFYETLNTRFSVNTAHTTINSTSTFGELSIRIGLFNNVAGIELRPDKMAIALPNLNNAESIVIAKDTISLAHGALAAALPDVTLAASNFTLNAWITMEGGAAAAERLLDKRASPADPIDTSSWGASASRYGLRVLSRNDAEGWTISIFGDPSLVSGAHLFLAIELGISRTGLRPIGEQISFAETKLPQIFKALGLNFSAGESKHA